MLVGVALYIDLRSGPVLLVDQIDDEPLELRRVLDAVLRLTEDHSERPRLTAELLEDVPVRRLQVIAICV